MKAERILSIIAALLVPLPLFIASMAIAYEGVIRLDLLLIYLTAAAVAWILGILAGLLQSKVSSKFYALVNMARIVVGIALAVGSDAVLFLIGSDSISMIFFPLALIACYILGYRLGNGAEPLTFAIMGIFFVEGVFTYPLCYEEKTNGHIFAGIIFALTLVFIVLSAVILNLRNVERVSYKGNGVISLSKPVVRFNVKRTLGLMAALLLFFFLAPPLAGLLWEGIKAFVQWLLELLSKLGQTQNGNYGDSDIGNADNIVYRRNIILEIIMTIAAAVMIALLIKPAINALAKLLRRIKLRLGIKDEYRATTSEYIDVYEESGYDRRDRTDTFKKAYKAFLREKDPTKKYRMGYKAYMIKLKETAPSDTTGKHLVKGRRVYGDDMSGQLEDAVSGYDSLRYNDKIPTEEELNRLSGMLKNLAKKR